MSIRLESLVRMRFGRSSRAPQQGQKPVLSDSSSRLPAATIDITPDDPIVAYFLSDPGPVEVEKLHLDSPMLQTLRQAGIEISIPLVSQGELVGVLNLGPRLSQQEYSKDDRSLLNSLATQAAPALQVAQMVRDQQAAIRARERLDQELRVARLIQRTLLPKDLPALPGWQLAAYYQPARAVGGDFYDFLAFENGWLGIVIGDVSDKGVPAALVMATTRSILRTAAHQSLSPGEVLRHANDLLCPDIPPNMFVTCFYAVLDPASGLLRYANAGQDLPYYHHGDEATELYVRGMPLGLLPGMQYEEKETTIAPGESILLYSDGLVEAHNPAREMFGFPRTVELVKEHAGGKTLIDFLLQQLADFTGPGWEQEDDVTLVTLERTEDAVDGRSTVATATPSRATAPDAHPPPDTAAPTGAATIPGAGDDDAEQVLRTLAEWSIPSARGNERVVLARVAEIARTHGLSPERAERLAAAAAEATMNAMEHGNRYQEDLPVLVQIAASERLLAVRIRDQGSGIPTPDPAQRPDIEAKLEGKQSPRGWGLFLIEHLVDDVRVSGDATQHTIELRMTLEGDSHDGNAT